MCGVHPDAEFIVKGIGQRLYHKKNWRSFVRSIKDHEIIMARYSFNPKKSVLQLHEELKELMLPLIKKAGSREEAFMGFYVFPDREWKAWISERALCDTIGSMVGDIYANKTGNVATNWYSPKTYESAGKRRPNYRLPVMNILLILHETIPAGHRIAYARSIFRKTRQE